MAPMDYRGEYLLGEDGRPILDRYGRPIRLRTSAPSPRGAGRQERRETYRNGYQQPHSPQEYRRAQGQNGPQPQRQPRQPHLRQEQRQPRQPQRYQAQPQAQAQPQHQLRLAPGQTPPRRRPAPQQPAAAPRPPAAARPARRHGAPLVARPRVRPPRARLKLPRMRAVLAFVLVLAVASVLWADMRLNRVAAMPAQHVAKTSGSNWLLVGSDSRAGLSDKDVQRLGTGGDIGNGRADTMMLLHLPAVGKPTLVSLPRDSYLQVPGYGMQKLNSAYYYGGAPLLVQTVESATGLRINHYAEIGMGGLATIVDAVGGTTICPAAPINDPLAHLNIAAGCQKVDGPTALGYVRTRATPLGDLDRVARQREFLGSLLKSATSPATLLNPLRVIPMVDRAARSLTVHKSDHIWHFARVALALRSGVESRTVEIASFADYDVGNVAIWDQAAAAELFASLR